MGDSIADRIELLREEVERLTAMLDVEGWTQAVGEGTGRTVMHPALASRRSAILLMVKLQRFMPPEPVSDAHAQFLFQS